MNEFGDTAVSKFFFDELLLAGLFKGFFCFCDQDIEGMHLAFLYRPFFHTCNLTIIHIAKTINVSSPSNPTAEGTEEFLELANGCLCCSIKDSGVAAIEKLMQKKGAFDYILLETTGLADPGVSILPIAFYIRKLDFFAFSRSNCFYVLAERRVRYWSSGYCSRRCRLCC